MFFKRKPYRISLGNVYDEIEVVRGEQTLNLSVDESPAKLVQGLADVHKRVQTMNRETPDAEWTACALMMAGTIFGQEQAQRLLDFYKGDHFAVINVCTKYYSERLQKLIKAVQTRRK